jgi:tRNA-splicing ligase RtcB
MNPLAPLASTPPSADGVRNFQESTVPTVPTVPTSSVIASPVSVPGATAPAAPLPSPKLCTLELDADGVSEVDPQLTELARLPFVTSVLGLPDRHQKPQMEVPSSIAIVTHDHIVPEFTSVAVNDGMGVVVTDLDAGALSPERIAAFFARIGSHSAGHVLETNRYSLSASDMRRTLTEGGRAVTARYGLDPSVVKRMENNACISLPAGMGDRLDDLVPWPLLHGKFCRSEMGLNFGGNHFLELQVVDRVLDRAQAAHWGLREGQVVVMYHLGPGPFSGTLLHHYSLRSKLDANRAPAFMMSKLAFHYLQRAGKGSLAAKWHTHFERNRWTPIPVESEEGRTFRAAMAMAMNFGYAYRLATVSAIMDGLREAISPRVHTALLCDISHNGISEELQDGRPAWVARHNACRLVPGQPTLVAGAWDVPSYLGLGEAGGRGEMHSYDHGAGHLIETSRGSSELAATGDTVTRVKMTRGRHAQVTKKVEVPVLSPTPIDRLMDCFARQDVMRSVVRLRPIGNFKN